jgi:hypothetical protein
LLEYQLHTIQGVTPTVPASICLNAEENIPPQLTKSNNFKRFENLDSGF